MHHQPSFRPHRASSSLALTTTALLTLGGSALACGASAAVASAQPVPEPASETAPEPVDPRVPSSPPSVVTFDDGWTVGLSATNETQLPVPSLAPQRGSRDVLVGGVFTGSLGNPAKWAAPSGTMTVGYQVGCNSPDGFPFSMIGQIKPGEKSIEILSQEFSGTQPTLEIAGYRLHIDQCAGPAFIRSFATLTRTGDDAGAAVYYYGVPRPV